MEGAPIPSGGPGADPADVLEREGPEALRKVVDDAPPAFSFLIGRAAARGRSTPWEKADAVGAVIRQLAAVENAMGVIKLSNDDAYGALRHFQTTEVMHFSVPSEVARSLYYQAQCWEKIGDAEMHAARLRDLKELYPKSEWARKL